MNIQTGIVKHGDANIEYFSQGEGEAVVLLPGGSLNVEYLAPLAAVLAEGGYTVVRINPRGAGQSTGPDVAVSYHTFASDVAAVIQTLHLAPAHVVGHAYGNRIARTLAADQPDLVCSVSLLAAGGKVTPDPATQRALGMLFNPQATEAESVEAMHFMVGNPTTIPQMWQALKSSRAPGSAVMQVKAAHATPEADWWAPPGEQPYLVVQGLLDKPAPPENVRLLKQDMGERLTVVELPTAGHLMPVENPAEVATALLAFFRRV